MKQTLTLRVAYTMNNGDTGEMHISGKYTTHRGRERLFQNLLVKIKQRLNHDYKWFEAQAI